MARKPDTSAATEVLEEIESIGDRAMEWVGENPRIVIATLAIILGAALIYGVAATRSASRAEAGAAALAAVRDDYLTAMGAAPGALVLPELANPEAAKRVHEEFRERFAAVAAEYSDTTAGAMAWTQVGDLQRESGDLAAAIETWRAAMDDQSRDSAMRGILLERIAQVREDQGRWLDAAEAHAQAGGVDGFPLRAFALADAARCYASAGETEQSLATFDRLDQEFPDFTLPDFLRSLRRELQARAAA